MNPDQCVYSGPSCAPCAPIQRRNSVAHATQQLVAYGRLLYFGASFRCRATASAVHFISSFYTALACLLVGCHPQPTKPTTMFWGGCLQSFPSVSCQLPVATSGSVWNAQDFLDKCVSSLVSWPVTGLACHGNVRPRLQAASIPHASNLSRFWRGRAARKQLTCTYRPPWRRLSATSSLRLQLSSGALFD
jgi:hypothetical protein